MNEMEVHMRFFILTFLLCFMAFPAYAQSLAIDVNAPTNKITAAATSASVQLSNAGGKNVVISNDSDKTCFVKGGGASVTAAATDFAILQGTVQRFSKDSTVTYIAAICEAGVTGTIYISDGPGE